MKEPVTGGRAESELEQRLDGDVPAFLAHLAARSGELAALLREPQADQERQGYRHTLREIAQQPITWIETAESVAARVATLERELRLLGGSGTIALTGSGSSLYAGECLSPALQAALRLPVQAVAAGMALTHPAGFLPPSGACLLVSFARSGNSPESCGVLDAVREAYPACRHLVITCNGQGRLATSYRDDPRVSTVVLDDKTHDRSLVMTSSFTNMVLAGRLLALTGDLEGYRRRARAAARLAARLLRDEAEGIARIARGRFRSAVYLGSGCRYGSARESALKMLEMTGGRVKTFPETCLGLRHGPMAAIDAEALVVCFLSSDPVSRAYEIDLVRELNRKGLGAAKVIFGEDVPRELLTDRDLVVPAPGLSEIGDDDSAVLDVLVGQLLAFFRCRAEGLRPDQPSDDGVINRVVEDFTIHRRS
jgi:tagatose-6-phosphate ketose/aldose isomerase